MALSNKLAFDLVEEIETTMGEAAKRGIFGGNAEWTDRAAKEPNCRLFVYTHPQIILDEDGFVEDVNEDVHWVIFYVQDTQAIFCSVQDMMNQEPWQLRRHAKVWVK